MIVNDNIFLGNAPIQHERSATRQAANTNGQARTKAIGKQAGRPTQETRNEKGGRNGVQITLRQSQIFLEGVSVQTKGIGCV